MKTVHLCKFGALYNQEPVEVTIIIDRQLPEFEELFDDIEGEEWCKKVGKWYQDEAETLINALYHALPQGTFDRLGIEFMKKKTSLYRGKTDH